ncbi:MAG: hypothetical protein HGA71_20575 [Azonexaceae bacterium]|nr:hypothetical protein [Azonexaceae bacterium]
MVFAFGHGDGGGGPTRDHLEFLRRERDLEGLPRTRMALTKQRTAVKNRIHAALNKHAIQLEKWN